MNKEKSADLQLQGEGIIRGRKRLSLEKHWAFGMLKNAPPRAKDDIGINNGEASRHFWFETIWVFSNNPSGALI